MVTFRIYDELKQSVINFIISIDNSVATEHADLEIQNLPKPKWYAFFIIRHLNSKKCE